MALTRLCPACPCPARPCPARRALVIDVDAAIGVPATAGATLQLSDLPQARLTEHPSSLTHHRRFPGRRTGITTDRVVRRRAIVAWSPTPSSRDLTVTEGHVSTVRDKIPIRVVACGCKRLAGSDLPRTDPSSVRTSEAPLCQPASPRRSRPHPPERRPEYDACGDPLGPSSRLGATPVAPAAARQPSCREPCWSPDSPHERGVGRGPHPRRSGVWRDSSWVVFSPATEDPSCPPAGTRVESPPPRAKAFSCRGPSSMRSHPCKQFGHGLIHGEPVLSNPSWVVLSRHERRVLSRDQSQPTLGRGSHRARRWFSVESWRGLTTRAKALPWRCQWNQVGWPRPRAKCSVATAVSPRETVVCV
jgi:hypothetical protein